MPDIKISQLNAAQNLNPEALVPVIQPDPNNGGVIKNFSVKASQFNSGVQLLGKLIGANLNIANTAVITYTEHTGFAFQPGDTVNDSTGANATIISDSGSAITVTGIDTTNGSFTSGSSIAGTIGQISYSTSSDTFHAGETITGATSGAQGSFDSINTTTLNLNIINGIFIPGETLTGNDSGATCTIDAYAPPATATLSAYTFSGADQAVILSGGNTYIVTDVVLTNASPTPSNVDGASIYTGTGLSGHQIAVINGHFNQLLSSANYFNGTTGVYIGPPLPITSISMGASSGPILAPITCGNTLYFSLTSPQGNTATADIYIYGYVLN